MNIEIDVRKRGEELNAFLVRFSDAARGLTDPRAVARTACRMVVEQLGTDESHWTEIDWTTREYIIQDMFYAPGAGIMPICGRHLLDLWGPITSSYLAGRSVVLDDVQADPGLPDAVKDAMAAFRLAAALAVPVMADGKLLAVLAVSQQSPRGWTPEEVALVEGVAGRCWAEVERARAAEALRESEAWLAAQKEAFQTAVTGAPLEASLGVLVRTAEQADTDLRCGFYIADPSRSTLHHVSGMPGSYADCVDGFKIGPDGIACGLAFYTGGPVITSDVNEDPRWEPWLWLAEQHAFRACWSFPIETSAGNIVGTFAMYFKSPREATPRDHASVAILTRAAAIIISRHQEAEERARAEGALRASEERLRLSLAAARMGIWSWDVEADLHSRDANLNQLLGLTPVETTQPFTGFLGHIHPDDRAAVQTAFDTSVRQGRPLSIEFRIVRPNGMVRWLRDQGDVFGEAGAQVRQMAGACMDITDLKEVEADLKSTNDDLDVRVRARTAELATTLASLKAEMSRRQDLARRLASAQEDERQRVSRELHDSVGQLLAGLSLAFKAMEIMDGLPPPMAAKFAEAQAMADALGKEVHGLAVRLRPTALDDLGLDAAIGQLVKDWSDRSGVSTDIHTAGLGRGRLSPEVETSVYRVVQEALTNVGKHAQAAQASVVVTLVGGRVAAVVEDDGVGFDPESAGGGRLGLMGMRERAALVGGALDIESSPGRGTTVVLRIPVGGGGEG